MAFRPSDYQFLALHSALVKKQNSDLPAWAHYDFGHIETYLQPKSYSLVPTYLFDSSKAPLYLRSNGLENTSACGYDNLALLKSTIVFPLDDETSSRAFPHSSHGVLLNYLASLRRSQSAALHIHLDVEKLNVFILKKGSLELANAFHFKAKEDILYYTLSACQQLSIDLSDTEVSYSGFMRPKTALYQLFLKYFPRAAPLELPSSFRFDPCFATVPKHLYLDAFILPTCE